MQAFLALEQMFGVAPAYEVLQLVESRESSREPSKAQAAAPDSSSSDPNAPSSEAQLTNQSQSQGVAQGQPAPPSTGAEGEAKGSAEAASSSSAELAAASNRNHKASVWSTTSSIAPTTEAASTALAQLPELDAAQCAALHAYLYALHLRLSSEHPTMRTPISCSLLCSLLIPAVRLSDICVTSHVGSIHVAASSRRVASIDCI